MPLTKKQREKIYYKTDDIALLFDVCETTIRRWIRTEKLPALKRGNYYKVERQDLLKFAQENNYHIRYKARY